MSHIPRQSGPSSVLNFPVWRAEDANTPGKEPWPAGEVLALTSHRTIEHSILSSSFPIDDSTSLVMDPTDNTKTMRIDVGAVSASTTRVLTMPDRNVNLAKDATFADLADTVLRDGSIPLTADWDVGAFDIRAAGIFVDSSPAGISGTFSLTNATVATTFGTTAFGNPPTGYSVTSSVWVLCYVNGVATVFAGWQV